MTVKKLLHAAAVYDESARCWHSLPPHVPGPCYGADGEPCPETTGECPHRHQTSRAAFRCSQNRSPQ